MSNRILLILFILSASFKLHAQGDLAPKYSNEFLNIGVGAKALGMSNSVIAGVNDVTAAYWNPAGLTGITDFLEIGAMHAEYFAGISNYDYIGLAKPLTNGGVGAFSMIRFAVDDIPNTTQLIDANGQIDYDKITSFSAGDYAFLFSYAQKLKIKGLSVGGNFKVIYRHVGDFAKSIGFGLDAGATYIRNDKWRFGLMLRDVTSTFNAWSYSLDSATTEVFKLTGNEIPENALELTLPKIIIGAQFKQPIKTDFYILSELNIDINTDGRRNVLIRTSPSSIDPHMGVEFGYKKFAAVRFGVGNMQWIKNADLSESLTFQPNIGLGIGFKNIQLDYAFTDIGDASVALYSHIFSLKINLKEFPLKKSNE